MHLARTVQTLAFSSVLALTLGFGTVAAPAVAHADENTSAQEESQDYSSSETLKASSGVVTDVFSSVTSQVVETADKAADDQKTAEEEALKAAMKAKRDIKVNRLMDEVKKHLGVKYVWGGTTPAGFDCSGLVQYCYAKALKINLPRTTFTQQHAGVDAPLDKLMTGDLLFWTSANGQPHHVAIYLSDGKYIHAPHTGDVVRIASMENNKPAFARRIIPETPQK